MKQAATAVCPQKRTDALVRMLAAEAFLVLFQAYMVAPLIPSLAESLGALSVLILALQIPIWLAAIVVSTLSLGYDMTQPLFAGMATTVGDEQTRGLAVGLSACILFLGYGTGAFIFQLLNTGGLNLPFAVFGSFELLSGILAFWIFRHFR